MTATLTRNDARPVPTFGMGFGQQGYWGNRHFATEELARCAYEKYLAETRAIYGKAGRQFVEGSILPVGDLVEGIRFVPLKKNGAKGCLIHTVQLYRISSKDAEAYLRDPFYACESVLRTQP